MNLSLRHFKGLDPEKDTNEIQELKDRRITLIFDEAHYAEGTERTKNIINYLNPENIIYLTATPYTDSLSKQFGKDFEKDFEGSVFKFSIQEELEEFETHPADYNYTPVRLSLVGIQNSVALQSNSRSEELWSEDAVEKFKQELDKRNCRTFIYFCSRKEQAKAVSRSFKSFGLNCKNIADKDLSSTEFEDIKKKVIDAKKNDEFFGVIACKRGGTGVTWKGLDAVVFYNAPNSAIDFIQKSYRCANPSDEGEPVKEKAYVFCLNTESALNIYATINRNEAKLRNVDEKENFEKFKQVISLEGEFADKLFTDIVNIICKKFSYNLFELPAIDFSGFLDSKIKNKIESANAKLKDRKSNKETSKKNKNTKTSNDVEKTEDQEEKDKEEIENNIKRNVFEKYVAMFEVVDYIIKKHPSCLREKFNILEIEKYPGWLQHKVENVFTLEQWRALIESSSSSPEIIENYIKNIRKTEQKSEEEFAEELKRLFPDVLHEEKTTVRSQEMQAMQKKQLQEISDQMFPGTEIQYAHTIPFKEIKDTDVVYAFENALLLPEDIHKFWDDGYIVFKILENNYLEIHITSKGKLQGNRLDGYNTSTSEIPVTTNQKKWLLLAQEKYGNRLLED